MMEPNFFNNSEMELETKEGGAVRAVDVLRDANYVLVYFSAHWCPPCRDFTPLLKNFYDQHHAKKNFEIVFLSFDKSEKEMRNYFKTEHGNYYCLPYKDAKTMSRVWMDTYGFTTIPTLLLFYNHHPRKLITRRGREMVESDPAAENFPWEGADNVAPPSSIVALSGIYWKILLGLVLLVAWSFFSKI